MGVIEIGMREHYPNCTGGPLGYLELLDLHRPPCFNWELDIVVRK